MIKIKKLSTILLAALLTVGSMTLPVKAEGEQLSHQIDSDDLEITTVVDGEEGVVPTFKYGKSQKLTFRVKNNASTAFTNVKVSVDLQGDDASKWPFTTKKQSYSKMITALSAGETVDVSWKFKEKSGVKTQRYTIYLNVKADCDLAHCHEGEVSNNLKDSAVYKIYVNTTGSGGGSSNDNGGGGNGGADNDDDDNGGGDDDGGSSGGATPRVIVTGFTTKPAEVQAGEKFTLVVHVKNTSKKQKVGNLLFDFNAGDSAGDGEDSGTSAPSFLPTSGASTVYVDSIGANKTADVSIEMTADRNLSQAPYSMEISCSFEDANHDSLESNSSLTIPVKQKARYEFSSMEILPSTVNVGDQANLTGTINNMGRTTLYNAKVHFEGNGIESEPTYLGNISAGGSTSIDAMLTATEVTEGPEVIQMVFVYEDSEGKEIKDTEEFTIEIVEADESDGGFDENMEEEEESGSILPILLAILAIILVLTAATIFLKRKLKNRKKKQEEDFFDEFDDDDEDDDLRMIDDDEE